MNAMIGWLVPIIWGISAFIFGVAIIAFSELLLCIREIALNTRKEGSDKEPQYHALPTIASIFECCGMGRSYRRAHSCNCRGYFSHSVTTLSLMGFFILRGFSESVHNRPP